VRIARSAVVSGTARLGEGSLLAQGAVIRSHGSGVEVGTGSAVLENSVIVGTTSIPTIIGRRSVFGHRCLVIGAVVGDLCEIGNASILMPGARLGDRVFLGEGTLVPAGTTLPSDVVAVGRPARVIRSASADDLRRLAPLRDGDPRGADSWSSHLGSRTRPRWLCHPPHGGGRNASAAVPPSRTGYLRFVFNASAKAVVGAFAVTRVAIGVAFALAPGRLAPGSAATDDDTLMTRSFAVREVVLGVGGLVAVARAEHHPSDVRLWAGLGALTDGGDLCASVASIRRQGSSSRVPAVVAAAGLVCELWAFCATTPDRRPGLVARSER
jgi:carbonic anhydrase/acetyltransferase-like protein (isoleucine patch superfamily)